MYNAEGSPNIYTPKGTKLPYKTPTHTQMYCAQGNTQDINNMNPIVYTPNKGNLPYKTPPLSPQMYGAQGTQEKLNSVNTSLYTPNNVPSLSQKFIDNQKMYRTPNSVRTPESTIVPGNPQIVEKFQNIRPAFVDQKSESKYWEDRTIHGYPLGASEWEQKAKEKNAPVKKQPEFVPVDMYPLPPRVVQDPTFVPHTAPTNFRGANEREVKGLEKPAYIDSRPNNTANKGCFYTVDGEIKCNN